MADNLQVSTYELFSDAMYIWNVYSHNAVSGIRTCNLWSLYISVKPNNKDNIHNMIQNTDLKQKWERSQKKRYYQFLSNKKKMVPGEKPNVHNKYKWVCPSQQKKSHSSDFMNWKLYRVLDVASKLQILEQFEQKSHMWVILAADHCRAQDVDNDNLRLNKNQQNTTIADKENKT